MRKYGSKTYQKRFFTKSLYGVQSQECKIKTIYNQNVDNFIKQYGSTVQQTQLFRRILQQKLRKRQQQINSQDPAVLSEYFTFIWNPNQLPRQFQDTLYTIYNRKFIDPVYMAQLNKIDRSIIKSGCYKAAYQSLQNNGPYLQRTISQFKKSLRVDGDNNNRIMTALKSLLKLTGLSDQKMFDVFVSHLQKVKPYGKLLIDLYHIQTCGSRQYIDGKIYYTTMSAPYLKFSIDNSFLQIYYSEGNNMKLIPQQQFDLKFLRSMQQNLYNANKKQIMNIFNGLADGTIKPNSQRKQFMQKYLNQKSNYWDTYFKGKVDKILGK